MTDNGSFEARLDETLQTPLKISRFVQRETPGNVGLCLGGGGSRAMSAAMGQLRALKHLQANGASLLSQVKALSTVSGSAWVGVPFVYLTEDTSDDDFLNLYVPDQGRLVPSETEGHSLAETLDDLPKGNIGNSANSRSLSPILLALEGLLLHTALNVPLNMLWQTLMANIFLRGYGLYDPSFSNQMSPQSLFSYDQAILERDVVGPNPDLSDTPAHLFAVGPERISRPYLICNTAMFLDPPGGGGEFTFRYLAHVQATSFFTGIVGEPDGLDANGKPVGGGGVTSFAFSSNPILVDGSSVRVDQSRQWALADIVGASSAAFAGILENLFAKEARNAEAFLKGFAENREDLLRWVETVLPAPHRSGAVQAVETLAKVGRGDAPKNDAARVLGEQFSEQSIDSFLDSIQSVIPEYAYWPVLNASPAEETKPSRFADGGILENSGICGMLTYEDIDSIIACVNSARPLAAGEKGVIDAEGNEIPDTRIIVDASIPPLFGYQQYDESDGYKLFQGDDNPRQREAEHNLVFPPEEFPAVLQGLWSASGNQSVPGSNAEPAIFSQTLAVLPNDWFGVRAPNNRMVKVVWVYTNRVKAWYDLLRPDVLEVLGDFDDPGSFHSFPHYSTLDTRLSKTQINLLANLCAWTIANDDSQQEFIGLFED